MAYPYYKPIKKPTELCEIAFKYGTDKCPRIHHFYTPFYYDFFKDKRESMKKFLELGIGGRRVMKFTPQYVTGASLRMWRDFFPNAQIYGADYTDRLLFEDERIKTYLCDSRKKEDLVNLIKQTGSDLDVFLDDGDHRMNSQLQLCLDMMPLLQKKVTYIIEDVGFPMHLEKAIKPHYKCWFPDLKPEHRVQFDRLLVVTNYD